MEAKHFKIDLKGLENPTIGDIYPYTEDIGKTTIYDILVSGVSLLKVKKDENGHWVDEHAQFGQDFVDEIGKQIDAHNQSLCVGE